MKTYIYTLGLVLYLTASLGFILPYLFSSHQTELVLIGVVYICSLPVITFYWIKSICNLADKAEEQLTKYK